MRNRIQCAASGLTLLLTAVACADAPPAPADGPPAATLDLAPYRELFAGWDINHDGYLDKRELARAFRGPDARPYDLDVGGTAGKAPDVELFPDFHFLVKLDRDGDGRISLEEFLTWAKDAGPQFTHKAEVDERAALLEARIAASTDDKEIKALERELKKEQTNARKLEREMAKELRAFHKLLKEHIKKHKS